ncbi:hypothetical protein SDC9_137691 [bioreactor metagenome]|uniref:Uncharacterized protein n=1 Tax=bioreactor metagenome TaxID=1076179 RepID=A0A645DMA0_9ZZZZ
MHRSVLAIEQKRIRVERLHGNRVHALRILEDRLPVPAHLPFFALIDVLFSHLFVFDIQRVHHQLVGERFAQLHRFQTAYVGFPAFSPEDVPKFSLRHIARDPAVVVRKQPAVADVRIRIARVAFWAHCVQRGHTRILTLRRIALSAR